MLDSDVGNQILPYVRFYEKEELHGWKTEQEGRPIFHMVDMVRIEIPGNQYSIIDTLAGEHHKRNYPVQWARYQNEKSSDTVDGTPLSEWSILRPSQVSELKHFHFRTIDQVAIASDDQVNKITSVVGMAGHAFREKARQYLKLAKDSATVQKQEDELHKRDEKIEELNAKLEQLMLLMNPQTISNSDASNPDAITAASGDPAQDRKKPGPKPKDTQDQQQVA